MRRPRMRASGSIADVVKPLGQVCKRLPILLHGVQTRLDLNGPAIEIVRMASDLDVAQALHKINQIAILVEGFNQSGPVVLTPPFDTGNFAKQRKRLEPARGDLDRMIGGARKFGWDQQYCPPLRRTVLGTVLLEDINGRNRATTDVYQPE